MFLSSSERSVQCLELHPNVSFMFVFQEQRYPNLCKQRSTTILHFGLQSAGFIKKRELSVRKSSSIGWHWQSQRGHRQVYRHPALDNRCLSELQSRRLWTPIQKAQDCNPEGSGLQFGHRETGVSPYQYCSTYKEVLDTRYSEVIICFDYLIAAEIDYFHCHL